MRRVALQVVLILLQAFLAGWDNATVTVTNTEVGNAVLWGRRIEYLAKKSVPSVIHICAKSLVVEIATIAGPILTLVGGHSIFYQLSAAIEEGYINSLSRVYGRTPAQ